MHISKAGGTAVKFALKNCHFTKKYVILVHPHAFNLEDLAASHKVVFFVRDPITRFVSGFNSRFRGGQPRYQGTWSQEEATAFEIFQRPGQLAEALSTEDPVLHMKALHAMNNIGHVRSSLARWLISPEYLSSKADQILFIGFLENLELDFTKLKAILGLPQELSLPLDEIMAHRTPASMDRHLSPLARQNLEQWYVRDYIFYHECKKLYEQRFA